MATLHHRCLVLGAPTGYACEACDASLEAAEERQQADEARFHERAEALAAVEDARWARFGGKPGSRETPHMSTTTRPRCTGKRWGQPCYLPADHLGPHDSLPVFTARERDAWEVQKAEDSYYGRPVPDGGGLTIDTEYVVDDMVADREADRP